MLPPQVMRNWKVATYLIVGLTTFHTVLITEYTLPTDRPHVFTPLQEWYKAHVDRLLSLPTLAGSAAASSSSSDDKARKP